MIIALLPQDIGRPKVLYHTAGAVDIPADIWHRITLGELYRGAEVNENSLITPLAPKTFARTIWAMS